MPCDDISLDQFQFFFLHSACVILVFHLEYRCIAQCFIRLTNCLKMGCVSPETSRNKTNAMDWPQILFTVISKFKQDCSGTNWSEKLRQVHFKYLHRSCRNYFVKVATKDWAKLYINFYERVLFFKVSFNASGCLIVKQTFFRSSHSWMAVSVTSSQHLSS